MSDYEIDEHRRLEIIINISIQSIGRHFLIFEIEISCLNVTQKLFNFYWIICFMNIQTASPTSRNRKRSFSNHNST